MLWLAAGAALLAVVALGPWAWVSLSSRGHVHHLADAPAVKCYINTYDPRPVTLDLLLEKLSQGAEAFTGVSPADAFCGFIDTRI